MDKKNILVGVLLEETTTITFTEVCEKYRISEALLLDMIDHGLFIPQRDNSSENQLNQQDLRRMESAFRLHCDLGINLPGVAVALDLLEQIADLQKELSILRKHFEL